MWTVLTNPRPWSPPQHLNPRSHITGNAGGSQICTMADPTPTLQAGVFTSLLDVVLWGEGLLLTPARLKRTPKSPLPTPALCSCPTPTCTRLHQPHSAPLPVPQPRGSPPAPLPLGGNVAASNQPAFVLGVFKPISYEVTGRIYLKHKASGVHLLKPCAGFPVHGRKAEEPDGGHTSWASQTRT